MSTPKWLFGGVDLPEKNDIKGICTSLVLARMMWTSAVGTTSEFGKSRVSTIWKVRDIQVKKSLSGKQPETVESQGMFDGFEGNVSCCRLALHRLS